MPPSAITVLFIISILLNIITLQNGHNWGADFAQYIIQAKNVLAHKPFTADIMLENPFSYPPGFSWLIAPVIAILDVDFKALKFLNVISWYGSLVFLYLIFRPRLGSMLAALGCLVLAFSSEFFVYKQNILSDVPFLFFVTMAVYVFLVKCQEQKKTFLKDRAFQVFLVLLVAAYLIRTAGIILFFSTIYYLIFSKKDWRRAGWTFGAMLLGIGIHLAVVGFHPGFVAIAAQDPLAFFSTLKAKAAIPLQSIFLFYFPELTRFMHELLVAVAQPLTYVSLATYLILPGVFIYKTIRKNISFIEAFIYLYFFALISWIRFETNPHTLVRLFLPITGFLLMSALVFLKEKRCEDLAKFLAVVILCLNLFNIFNNLKFNDDVLYTKENQELFSWVKENVGPEERYLFWEPRTMALMTGRVGTSPISPAARIQNDFAKRMADLNIAYYIMIKPVDQSLIRYLEGDPQAFRPRWENAYYKIFQTGNKK